MTGDAKKLNGSVALLAKAMRAVFSEAVEGAVAPLRDDIAGVSGPCCINHRTSAEYPYP